MRELSAARLTEGVCVLLPPLRGQQSSPKGGDKLSIADRKIWYSVPNFTTRDKLSKKVENFLKKCLLFVIFFAILTKRELVM